MRIMVRTPARRLTGGSAPLFREWPRSSEELALYPCGGTTGSEDSIREWALSCWANSRQ